MQIAVSERQREAAREAAALLSHQAEGLAATGSKKTVEKISRTLEALEKIAGSSKSVDLTPEEKVRIERATFLLQGTRVGLESADFHERASIVQRTIDELADVVGEFNAVFSESLKE